MNAPFFPSAPTVGLIDQADPRIGPFLHDHPQATAFHDPRWLTAVETGTGHRALILAATCGARLVGLLPLHLVHSPIFGRVMASTGFAVDGGILVEGPEQAEPLRHAATELATRLSCPSIELRGGAVPAEEGSGWSLKRDAHCGFVTSLADGEEAQLLAIPRKQRAEVRKGLDRDLSITTGSTARDRAAHYAVYAESVRNLGTPVFPRSLFAAVLDRFGDDADILTVWSGDQPVASVLSLYHRGAVMPYWGGGTLAARQLRANDRMYFALMRHARERGCARFDFGRSKTGSGAYHFKRNWGFMPEPLTYAGWTASGQPARDADPTSARHQALIAAWKRLPLGLANRIGPWIARGLG
ncbi:FemAB family XrtA/PEP-CTERM system-associated protein [Novosphingobium sp.]|uniref:FemAB family XrtA/PEP-CTERM system-associated protein n=1 Tax=Novosphingobium sp. TaxID=1874826 RepID=UPI002615639D|nr:FemAB family XrtA/PEP-CTERM system-associated protein [Novosphingobium sp.]